MLNVPLSVVTTSNVDPVALFFTVTEAPGITAPEESTTVPESEDRGPWPYAAALTVVRMMTDATLSRLCFIACSLGAHTTRSGRLRQLRNFPGFARFARFAWFARVRKVLSSRRNRLAEFEQEDRSSGAAPGLLFFCEAVGGS